MTNKTNTVFSLDNNIKNKELSILKGEIFDRDEYNLIKKEILDSNKSIESIIEDSLSSLSTKIQTKLNQFDSIDTVSTSESIITLPNILKENNKNNRFIQIDDTRYILSIFDTIDSKNILYLYEYLSTDNSITLIYKSNLVVNTDISYIKNQYSWDIIWNHKSNNYEFFWINNSNIIYWSTIDKVNKSLLKYRVISNSSSVKDERLSVSINNNGDRNIFTTQKNSSSINEPVSYTHIFNTESWIENIIKSVSINEYLAYGKQIVIDNTFYQVFHNKYNIIYICKLQCITNTVVFNLSDIATTNGTELFQIYYENTSIDNVTAKGIMLFSHNYLATRPKLILLNGQTYSISDINTITSDLNISTDCFYFLYNNGYLISSDRYTNNLGNTSKLIVFKNNKSSNNSKYIPYYIESKDKIISNISDNSNSCILDIKKLVIDNIISEK